ncbi:MAG: translation initiation factor IF-3 [Myxococcales bacterium]|nr:translation initiation factor IF-3 [Myxococcales bacterium]USN51919.1 MAG: translation initiation factor IF-3 [Myxococcales bacterium]
MSNPGGGDFSSQQGRKERFDEPRVNRRIRVPEIRVIGEDGEQLGIMPTIQALRRAEQANLDLVEVQPRAKPPVCKIMDYGKYKYEQSRKLAESKKKQQQIELKEIKFRPKTGDHDFEVKVKSLRRFLDKGDKGKVTVMFRGREIVHPEVGREMLNRVIEALGEDAIIEQNPRLEGRQMVMIVAPGRNGSKKSA